MFRWKSNKTSLSFRITITSLVTILMLTILMSTSQFSSFTSSFERHRTSIDEVYYKILFSSIAVDGDNITIDYNKTGVVDKASYYWQITDGDNKIGNSKHVADWIDTSTTDKSDGKIKFFIGNKEYLATQRDTIIGDKLVRALLGLPEERVNRFLTRERQHLLTLLVVPIAMYIILFFMMIRSQVQIIIKPLVEIENALKKVGSGENDSLEGKFPKEMQSLVDEMNSLLSYTSGVIERYKNYAGNLSHSIKHPIAILSAKSKLKDSVPSDIVDEQSEILLNIVESNLSRLKLRGSTNLIAANTACLPVIQRVCRGFAEPANIEVNIDCSEELYFHGDEGDLLELLGNLIKNASQYAASEIKISAIEGTQDITIIIDDDGAGIPKAKRDIIIERGKRLDETSVGHGLGLAICKDIVNLYNGSMVLGKSDLGGLKVELTLPRTKN